LFLKKGEILTTNVTRLGKILPLAIFTCAFSIFNLNKQFQSMICDTWFNIQKSFDAIIILSFDSLAAVLATYPKIG
jgi:hypothetical protein